MITTVDQLRFMGVDSATIIAAFYNAAPFQFSMVEDYEPGFVTKEESSDFMYKLAFAGSDFCLGRFVGGVGVSRWQDGPFRHIHGSQLADEVVESLRVFGKPDNDIVKRLHFQACRKVARNALEFYTTGSGRMRFANDPGRLANMVAMLRSMADALDENKSLAIGRAPQWD